GGDGYSPGNGGAAGRGSYSGGNGGDGLVVIQYNNTPVASNVDFSITPGANVSVPPNTSSVSNTAVLKMISGSATDGFFDGFVLDSTGNDQNMTLGISSSGGGSIIPPATVNFSFSYGNSQSSFAVGNTYTAYITEAVVNGISVLCGDKNQSNTSSPPLPYYEHCNIISSGPNLWVVAAAQSSSLYNNFISQVVGSNCGTGGYTVNSFDNNVQYVYCNILNNVKIKNNIAIHTAKFNITVVPAPTLTPTPHCSYIFLSWSPVAGAAKYVITRTTGGTNAQTSTTTGTTYSDNTAGLITMYAYTVQPVDANGASIGAPSNTMYANIDPYANNGPTVLSCKATNVTATTNCGTPTQAAAVLDAVLAAGAGSGNTPPSTGSYVTVSWTVPGDTANLVGYNIYRNGVKLNASPVTASPYYDPAANVSSVNSYVVKSVYTVNGAQTEVDSSSAVSSQTCNSNNTQSITVNATPASVCPSGATTFPVQVSWNQISGAGTYNLRIMSTDSSGNNPNYNYAIGVTSPYTDNNTVPNNIYTYTVTALDGSGNTIASGSSVPLTGTACPNNNNQSQVQLWFHGAMPTGQNANWNNQTKTVSAGTPVTLDYAWPSSLGLCNGRTDSYPTGSIPPASWNGISLSLSGNTQGSKTLNDLKQGTYILHVSCPNPNPNILVQLLSNTVKIIVTKTSIQEI
ncbi:MAG: hypothetical protein KGJ90_07105, partial [Patescibacteria group bacterium]|nr:hypothetical protein [Patescibacteria group bacterium]